MQEMICGRFGKLWMKSPTAAGASSVVVVAAVGANRASVVVGQAFSIPEPGAAVDTDLGHFLQTVRAKQAVMEFDQVLGGTAAA